MRGVYKGDESLEVRHIEIDGSLSDYEKAVYNAIATVDAMNDGDPSYQGIISYHAIYEAMGFDGEPNSRELAKIDRAVESLNRVKIISEECSRYHEPDFLGEHMLLMGESWTVENGDEIKWCDIGGCDETPLLAIF